jgi:hypothetical protein
MVHTRIIRIVPMVRTEGIATLSTPHTERITTVHTVRILITPIVLMAHLGIAVPQEQRLKQLEPTMEYTMMLLTILVELRICIDPQAQGAKVVVTSLCGTSRYVKGYIR